MLRWLSRGEKENPYFWSSSMNKLLVGAILAISLVATQQTANAQQPRQLVPQQQVGIVVTGVVPGTPAWQAGLERGDVIVSCNGVPIRNGADLAFALGLVPLSQLMVIDTRTGQAVPVSIGRMRNNTIGFFYRTFGR
jgi:S1-C subfamily serine protease